MKTFILLLMVSFLTLALNTSLQAARFVRASTVRTMPVNKINNYKNQTVPTTTTTTTGKVVKTNTEGGY